MSDPGSAISISLEDVASRIRAIAARRSGLPAPEAVGQTSGPSGGHSGQFAWRLHSSALTISEMTRLLGGQLHELELLLAATGEELVATDESIAVDVQALNRMADSVTVPASPGGTAAQGGAGSPTAAPRSYPPADTSDDDSAETIV